MSLMSNRLWNSNLLGVLATKDDTGGRKPVFVNTQNSLQFSIKIISSAPGDFPTDIKVVTCYADELEKWGFEEDFSNVDISSREIEGEKFLKDSLIVFCPEYKYGNYYIAKNVTLIAKKGSFKPTMSFIPIPVFYENEIDHEEFESRLLAKKYVGHNYCISTLEEDTPNFVIWENNNREHYIYGEMVSSNYAHGGFCFLPAENQEIHRLNVHDNWYSEAYILDKKIWFLPFEIHEEIAHRLLESESLLSIKKENIFEQQIIKEPNISEEKIEDKEDVFIKRFIEVVLDSGLRYAKEDLYNFHIAMKTQSLVLLAGMSGTGKSKLVKAYADALNLPESQIAMIPVRPNWTDDSDLLGYADTLNNVYRPGDSGLVDILIEAADNKEDRLYIVCFDEMNLARVEHYFSQFLSILETEAKQLRLYNEELQHRFYNGGKYPPIVPIRDNVLFVGTVNIDESIHIFSDKVLDRSNVIELSVLPFKELTEIQEKKANKIPNEKKKNAMEAKEYISFRDMKRTISLTEQELDCLWEIHSTLHNISTKMGIGPRIVRQIDQYIKNMPINCPFDRKMAFDLQIVQRILIKIRGSEDALLPVIGLYREKEDTVIDSKLFEIFESFLHLSDFEKSSKVIIEKAKELCRNGYTV